jgi:hypothetical protein
VPISFVLKYEALAGDDCYLGGSHGVMCAGDESGFYVQNGTTVSYFPQTISKSSFNYIEHI